MSMQADLLVHLSTEAELVCSNRTASLTVSSTPDIQSSTLVIGAGTKYDRTKGNTANGFSFKGTDPAVAAKSDEVLMANHVKDYTSLTGLFSLKLPDIAGSAKVDTTALVAQHSAGGAEDSYLDCLMFTYGCHLFIRASSEGSLPPNLQRRWATGLSNTWSGDYHTNIDFQM